MFVLAVVLIMLSVHAIVAGVLSIGDDSGFESFQDQLLNPGLFLISVTVAGLVILAGSLTKVVQLRGGGAKVALALGAREVSPQTGNLRERRLINVVEEMALAAGVPVPRIFIMDEEEGMNAFAAGFSTDDAAVAVTAGLLKTLNREELQAVIGHEFSHILNGDMRLNVHLLAGLAGILALAIAGRILFELAWRTAGHSRLRRSSRKSKGAGIGIALFLTGLGIWIVGSTGVLFARIIQSAVSRQREHLADASAVQFTRNPDGLARALMLIGASADGSKMHNSRASEVSHMLFASGSRKLFATHPSLSTRITMLVPTFDGNLDPARKVLQERKSTAHVLETGEGELSDDLSWLFGTGLPEAEGTV